MTDKASEYVCRECGSDRLAWDAIADEWGNIICQYDHHECLECELENTAIDRPPWKTAAGPTFDVNKAAHMLRAELIEAQRRIDAGEEHDTTAAELGMTPGGLNELLAVLE